MNTIIYCGEPLKLVGHRVYCVRVPDTSLRNTFARSIRTTNKVSFMKVTYIDSVLLKGEEVNGSGSEMFTQVSCSYGALRESSSVTRVLTERVLGSLVRNT